jgi:hypothetical protein
VSAAEAILLLSVLVVRSGAWFRHAIVIIDSEVT